MTNRELFNKNFYYGYLFHYFEINGLDVKFSKQQNGMHICIGTKQPIGLSLLISEQENEGEGKYTLFRVFKNDKVTYEKKIYIGNNIRSCEYIAAQVVKLYNIDKDEYIMKNQPDFIKQFQELKTKPGKANDENIS